MIDFSLLSAVEELISRGKAINEVTSMLYFRCGGKECGLDAAKRWMISGASLTWSLEDVAEGDELLFDYGERNRKALADFTQKQENLKFTNRKLQVSSQSDYLWQIESAGFAHIFWKPGELAQVRPNGAPVVPLQWKLYPVRWRGWATDSGRFITFDVPNLAYGERVYDIKNSLAVLSYLLCICCTSRTKVP